MQHGKRSAADIIAELDQRRQDQVRNQIMVITRLQDRLRHYESFTEEVRLGMSSAEDEQALSRVEIALQNLDAALSPSQAVRDGS